MIGGLAESYTDCWGSPAESKGDCFHLHCQAGGWDRIGCTGSVSGGRTFFDWHWQVFGDWAVSVHYEILQFAVFLNEKLHLWLCFACWPFSTVHSQVFWQECLIETPRRNRFGYLSQSRCLLELRQLAHLQYHLNPPHVPSKTCPVPVCIPWIIHTNE